LPHEGRLRAHVAAPGAARAVVIGSGIGGTAATLLLAHAGVPTTLIEKNRSLGGSCAAYEKRGFRVDVGTHMFCRGAKGPLGDVLRRVGSDGAIRFERTHDIAEIRFPARDGGRGVTCIGVPSELRRMPRFAWELVRALELSPVEAARALRFFTYVLTMPDAEVEQWDRKTVEDLVLRFTDHPATIGLFGFLLGLYFILPYWQVSAGEALYAFRHMARDNALSYPRGGASAIPTTYARLAESRGAEVRVGSGVKRIVLRDGRVAGVELADGSLIPATIVISTSSVRTTVLRLVGEEHFPADYVSAARAIQGSQIAVQAKIGLSKRLVDAGCLIGGAGEGTDVLRVSTAELRAMFDTMAAGRIPPLIPFYCPVPTNFDPTLAPPGCQLLTACAVAPTTDVALEDPGPAWEEALVRTLRRVVPGLDEHALFIDTFGVDFIERWIGKDFGPAVSTGQTPDQVGKLRPRVHTPIRGLYLAGCGAGARGVGTELAAASAIECVDRVVADLGGHLGLGPRESVSARGLELARSIANAPLAWAARS
jgi:prolycopene isomerase